MKAIQELHSIVREKDALIAEQQKRITTLDSRLAEVEHLLNRLLKEPSSPLK